MKFNEQKTKWTFERWKMIHPLPQWEEQVLRQKYSIYRAEENNNIRMVGRG